METRTITVEQARALQIADRMARTAGELMRLGGYPEPPEDIAARVSGAMASAAQALSANVGTLDPAPTDDEIDAAADTTAAAIVTGAFGSPPMAN
jgi:hypothetical protein